MTQPRTDNQRADDLAAGKIWQASRLKARHTLPGDMRSEWLHGWWNGIAVGFIIGLAGAVMVLLR